MDNDNKVIDKSEQIHQEVMLFLGDELNSIHKDTTGQAYDIEKEYQKTKKNRSTFVLHTILGCFVVALGIAIITQKVVSTKNSEISVSLQEFEDLHLKSLLDTVTSAQTNYDNAVKNKAQIEADMEVQLKSAAEARDNDIFVIDSMNLKYRTVYNDRIKIINQQYDDKVKIIHDEYDEKILQAEKQVQEYKAQLAEFDSAKIASAREQEKALASERKLRELETKKLTDKYEARIAELEKNISNIQTQNTENMRKSVAQVSKQYQKEIDALDPTIKDDKAAEIIDLAKQNPVPDFNGGAKLQDNSINSEEINNFVSDYQDLYDDYKYLDDVVASIPQKNSIPGYVSSARTLVNDMSETFMDANISFYKEKVKLNGKITDLTGQVSELNKSIEAERNEAEEKLAEQQALYEASLNAMLTLGKSNALVLRATDYEDIVVHVTPKARYLIDDAGEEGAAAEIRAGKGIKGRLYPGEKGTYRFEVGTDKEGNLFEVDFASIEQGTLVKILSK